MLPCLLCGVLDTVSLTRIKPSLMLRLTHYTHERSPCWKTSSPWHNQPSSWWFQSLQSVFLSLGVVSLLQSEGKE